MRVNTMKNAKRLRDFSPLGKFILMLAVIACTYLTDRLILIAGLIVLQGIVAWTSGAGRVYRTTLLALAVGALTLTLFQIFSISEGATVFTLIPPLGFGRVTDKGLQMSLLMSLRMVSSVGVISLVVALTPSTQIVSLVSGTFRLSPAYTCVLITALRFIPTFGERMGKVLEAEACRGYRADTANPFRKIGMILRLSLPLLVTCVRDVDSLALSLEARGFSPDSRTRPVTIKPDAFELTVLGCALVAMGVVVMLGRS
jgi:energy-coupling factor transport system permease protein